MMKNNSSNKKNLKALTITLSMVLTLSLIFIGATSLPSWSSTANADENKVVLTSPFTDAIEMVHNSVVSVETYVNQSYGYNRMMPFGDFNSFYKGSSDEQMLAGSGSGVVVAKDFVLTNYHVIDGASSVKIVVDEEEYEAEIVNYIENRDLAVLKTKGLPLEPVVLGDSDKVVLGDWAIVIGNPAGFEGTTTVGIISGIQRQFTNEVRDKYGLMTDDNYYMIQTDAAINEGNSGGGMFNTAGELIGVPNLKYINSKGTIDGIGMAVPINEAKQLIEDSVNGKTHSPSNDVLPNDKPRLGVIVNTINDQSAAVASGAIPRGAYVAEVEKGSPAEIAGIKAGDIVVEMDGKLITTADDMLRVLEGKNEGDEVFVKVYRVPSLNEAEYIQDIENGEYIDFTVSLKVIQNQI